MKQRVITAVIMTIIIAPIIYLGKFPLAVLCGVFAAIAAFELQHMFYKEKRMGFINYFTIVLSLAFYVLTLLTFLLPWNLKVILIEIISLFIILDSY